MQNNSRKRKKKISGTILGLSIVGVILLGFILWITPWVWYDNSPKPLGGRLEYVGKKHYGCWLGFCDSNPGTTSYYATDMSLEEVKSYFKKATLHDYSKANSFLDYSTLEFHS